MHLNLGDQVRIKDGSYMLTQIKGKLSHSSDKIPVIGWNKDIWTILLINVPLPTDYNYATGLHRYNNNCLIQNNINKELWFCSKINIIKE